MNLSTSLIANQNMHQFYRASLLASAVCFGLSGAAHAQAPAVSISSTVASPVSASPAALQSAIESAAAARSAQANDTDAASSATADVVRDIDANATEFQRFVQETTGRQLPLFGYNLFTGRTFPSLQNVPVPSDYVIGPGDEIALKVWGVVESDARLTVDRNGQISIPRVGVVNVAGLKSSELEPALKSQVGQYLKNFQLNATMGRLRSIQVFVVGQAHKPGAYTVSSLSSLVSVLFESGGPAAGGTMRKVQLKRNGQVISTIDLYKFIAEGDKSADTYLLPGDVVVIPPAGPRVAMIGALGTPAIYELSRPEEPLSQVLTYGGGMLSLTTPHKVLIERIEPSKAKAPRSVIERTLDARGLKSTVKDGDVVTLFKISPAFSNAVTLRGNVAAPLRYSYRPGMRIADLIPERDALIQSDYYTRKNIMVQYESGDKVSAGRVASEIKNLVEEINWEYAAIERMDPTDVRTQLIPFNLGKALREKDPAHNLELQPGDVVTIFGVKDMPVPVGKRTQFVRVSGEVKVPGFYQVHPGETLRQVVERAGGLTEQAYAYATELTRESTRTQQQANLDRAIRRLETDIAGQAITTVQNATSADTAASVQAQMAAQRQLLSRMQSLKASGRIALELKPERLEYPDLPLEDGDNITIPTRPGFVSVFGAVLAENAFIHREDATVEDYLERAGLLREADVDAALIIRADGSVEGNSAHRRWFGSGGFMGKELQPGDSIFVPEKFDRRSAYTQFIQGAKDWTSILYQFGLGAAALKTIRD
ncbi:MAG: SLBB domain-containing protein [Rhodoferax sp.]|nr:SLBB domain-containing protein [Rhodoferax sp.]